LSITGQGPGSILLFDTIANNSSSASTIASRGVNCTIPTALYDNIVVGNEVSANCMIDYSLFDTGTPGGHNRVGAPGFLDTDQTNPTAGSYYRIGLTSAAIDAADPASVLAYDIDLVPRPQGVTFDIGASEYKP